VNWRSLLLELIGARVEHTESITKGSLALRHGHWLGAAILAAATLAAIGWWSYRRDATEMTTRRQRAILTLLRVTFYIFLIVVLLRPVLMLSLETAVRRTLILLFDASASMTIEDPRYDDTDRKRAAIVRGELDARDGMDQKLPGNTSKPMSRRELLAQFFANDVLKLEERLRRDCDLSIFTFGQSTTDTGTRTNLSPWISNLECSAKATALGDAVRDLLQKTRGQSLAGIVIFSDGANNAGSSPLDAAREAGREKVPLLTVGLGVTSPRDLILSGILAQDTAFVNDDLPVAIRVRAQGLKGESAKLTVRFAGEVAGTKEIQLGNDAEQTVSIPFTPRQTGDFELQAIIDPRPDEAVKENNTASQRVRVVDSRVKVLYVESGPRWEFRCVQSAMVRDRRIDSKYVLIEGDPSIAEGADSPYLAQFPETKEALFKFDLLILGDVGPNDIGPERLAWIEEFVSRFGGSCLLIAGPRANPQAWKGAPLEKLLPVDLVGPRSHRS
jgi:hypothetical protein